MGKPTGFIDYPRENATDRPVDKRIADFEYIHGQLNETERKQQAARCMDCGVPFCQTSRNTSAACANQANAALSVAPYGCPLGNLIPEWNQQLWNDNLPMALDRLLKTNCFPEFTGYVCPAPCEKACSCRKASASKTAVSINDNERFIVETAYQKGLIQPHPPLHRSGKTVAVVGSGPAGLSVAALLNQRGHTVSVYERSQRPGGLLVYGIPNMKLPKSVVSRRIQLMEAEGVHFICNTDIGKDISVASLAEQHDAVVLALGAQKPRVVNFSGTATGVCYALDYLGAAARAYLQESACDANLNAHGKHVAIIGAGDTANDCIATALRQGASDIVQLIRRPASYYGAAHDYAHQETEATFGRDIRRFETQVSAVHANTNGMLQTLTLSTPEGPVDINAELLIVASGFAGTETYALQSFNAETGTNVFQAGDMATGASLVSSAMAHARNVAREVDTYLTGYSTL